MYSDDGGDSWAYRLSIPAPDVLATNSTNQNCPCDQNIAYDNDGYLYGSFLHIHLTGNPSDASHFSIYTAQSTNALEASQWRYKPYTPTGSSTQVSKKTNTDTLLYVDQPWLAAGPAPGRPAATQLAVAYGSYLNYQLAQPETRAAISAR
jgi:hypothetical protein